MEKVRISPSLLKEHIKEIQEPKLFSLCATQFMTHNSEAHNLW